MRISKKILLPAVFILIFILINSALSFVLRPYSGSGSEMWKGFENKAKIDVIFTGSSLCLCDIDPSAADKVTGLSSYNMGTNMQSIQSSFFAIRKAREEKNIKTAVLLIDPDTLEMERTDNQRAEQCFYRNYSDTRPFITRIKTDLEFVTGPQFIKKSGSLSYFFPWTYDRTSGIGTNIREKLNGTILDDTNHRDENGFNGSDEALSDDTKLKDFNTAKGSDGSSGSLHVLSPNEENLKTLGDIASYCNDNGIKLYVITPAVRTAFSYYDPESYMETVDTIRSALNKYGIGYYNFTLIKEEYFDLYDISYYRDNTHFNSSGATTFSTLLGEFMVKCDSGEDVSYMFYDLN